MNRRNFLKVMSATGIYTTVADYFLKLFPRDQLERAAKTRHRQDDSDLLKWTQRYLSSTQTCPPSGFHHWLTGELDTWHNHRGKRLNVLAPRGSAKSTTASLAYPMREALRGKEAFTVIVSDTAGQATRLLRQIKANIEGNELILEEYPESSGRGPLWRNDHIQLRNGCEIMAIGTGGKIRGAKSAANRRPTCIINDDLQRIEHVTSETLRERSLEWFNKDLMSAGEPDTNIIVLGTPLHRKDIVCTLESTPDWITHKWRSIVDWPQRMDLWMEWSTYLIHSDEEGKLTSTDEAMAFHEAHKEDMERGASCLWEAREPLLALMLHRATIGVNAFEAEKQSNPVSHELVEWPDDYFTHGAFWFQEWPQELTCKVIACDPSKGRDSKQGDYSAIIRYGRDKAGIEYIEADIKRRNVEALCQDLARHQKEFNADGIALETNGFQELLLIPMDHARKMINLDVLPVYTYVNDVPKQVRIRRLTAPLGQRKMRFKSRSAGTALLVQQMRDWPTGADDGPDALELGRRLAIELHNGKAMPRRAQAIIKM